MKDNKINTDKQTDNKENIQAEDKNINIDQQNNQIDGNDKQADCGDKQIDCKQKELDEVNSKLNECNDKYLRLYSEFDNYRKRTNKEKLDIIQNASESLIKDLLPVVDDYQRALQAIEKLEDEQLKKTIEGVNLVYKKLYTTLQQRGLKPIEAKGQVFDESLHEAISQMPASSKEEKGKVIEEVIKGYYLNDKVIRYSKVVVAI